MSFQLEFKTLVKLLNLRRLTLALYPIPFLAISTLSIIYNDSLIYRYASLGLDSYTVSKGVFVLCTLDLLFKVLFQSSIGINTNQYLVLPIKKGTIVRFILIKSLLGPPNIYYLLILPLLISLFTSPSAGDPHAGIFIFNIFIILLVNSLVGFLLKEAVWNSRLKFLVFGITLSLVITMEGYGSLGAFDFIVPITHHWLLLTSVLLLLLSFLSWITYKLIIQLLYDSDNIRSRRLNLHRLISRLLPNMPVALLIIDECYLIMRNKRTSQFLLGQMVMNIIIIYFIRDFGLDVNHAGYALSVMVFTISYAMSSYIQISFGWQSRYFAGLLSKPILIKQIFSAKILLFDLYNVVFYLISVISIGSNYPLLLIATAALCFNIGVNAYLLTVFTLFNTSPVDLSRSTIMNYEGVNSVQIISTLLFIATPLLVFQISSYFLSNLYSMGIVCLVGLISMGFHHRYLAFIAKAFSHYKFRILEGFQSK